VLVSPKIVQVLSLGLF